MKIKVVANLDHPIEGWLPKRHVGNIYEVKSKERHGYMVDANGEEVLVLFSECQIVSE